MLPFQLATDVVQSRPKMHRTGPTIDFMEPEQVDSDAETEGELSELESEYDSESDSDGIASDAESERKSDDDSNEEAAAEVVMRSQSEINKSNRASWRSTSMKIISTRESCGLQQSRGTGRSCNGA